MRCPACGASVHVGPQAARAPAPLGLDDLDLDLPVAKPTGAASAFGAKPAAAPKPSYAESADLPALKGAPDQRLSASVGDDLADLPAPKAQLKPEQADPITSTFDLDLPAPKANSAPDAAGAFADLPAPKPRGPAQPEPLGAKGKPSAPTSGPLLSELPAPKARADARSPLLSDLPAAKPKAVGPLLSDLPAPKTKQTGPLLSDLPAPKPRPSAASESSGPLLSDLPAPKAKPSAASPNSGPLLSDLPAPKQRPAASSGAFSPDLPAMAKPKGSLPEAPLTHDLDLPMAKGRGAPLPPDLEPPGLGTRPDRPAARLELDAPLAPGAPAPNTPKRSFARPSLADAKPGPSLPARAPEPLLGTMPKDSLAIEPKPFYGSAPPAGIFGKLDELGQAPQPPLPMEPEPARSLGMPDLVDLPAPSDLPAVKRAKPKATALGLGGGLARDSLDLPSGFDAQPAPLPIGEPEHPFGSPLDAPQVAPQPALSDLDLPAPRDLPVLKKKPAPLATALGLGSGFGAPSKGGFEVQLLNSGAATAQAHTPELSLDLPPMSGREQGHRPAPELDLGEFDGALDHMESKGGGSFGALDVELDLTPRKRDLGSFGELEPIELPTAAANSNTGPFNTMELAPGDLMLTNPGAGGLRPSSRRTDLGLELKGMMDLSSGPNDTAGTANFGELDLGIGRDSPAPMPLEASMPRMTTEQIGGIQDAELVELSEEEIALREKRRRRFQKKMPGWVFPVALIGTVSLTGVALGLFTHHGYFGVYLMEQLLPAAGDPARVAEAIQQAERKSKSDTYGDVRKALTILSDARNEAGLNIPLLTRSLLHEALYQLRFGEDAQSAQRAAAILARLMERNDGSTELQVARAADAARRGELSEANRLLAEAPAQQDAYRDLLVGELALLEQQAAQAERAFAAAKRYGAGARASWGLARAQLAAGKHDAARAAAEATLAESPRHAGAHTLVGEALLEQGKTAEALEHARIAAGRVAIDGEYARPSSHERAQALALEGHIEEALDHPSEAQAAYEQALAVDPLSVPVLLGSGRMLMRLGRPQDALSRFDSAISARPSATIDARGSSPLLDAGLGSVQALLALARAPEAFERIKALRAQFPEVAQVTLWYGHTLAALERWDEAEAAFRDTIEKAPKMFAGYVGLSQLLFKRERPEEAARLLSLASGKVDDGAEVRRMLGHSELARNHLPEAVQQFEAALRFDPRDAGALFGLAVTQRKSGDLDAAEQTLNRLTKVDPSFPGLALEQGQLLENRGEYARAIEAYRKALESRPTDSELKLRLGAALVTSGQADEAEGVLNQVLKVRPTSAEAEHYMGRVLFARNETAQAAQRFERAVNFDTLKAEYHMYLGWALLEQGNYGGALSSIEKAIARDPNLGDARWLLGRIQLRTGAVRDALGNFQAALRLKPGRTEALAQMGDAYDELRDLPQAIRSYQEALKKAPENAAWWYRLSRLQLDRGLKTDARSSLSEAVLRGDRLRTKPSWLADAHRAYADLLHESKRTAEANDHYRLFLELAPLGHPDRAEIEELLYRTRR